VEEPVPGVRALHTVVELEDAALATSGDYRNFFEAGGRRFSHEIDPRTGRPIAHALASVSVLAADCMRADAWATALIVLGPDEAFQVAVEERLDVLLLIRTPTSFEERATPGFARHVRR
jgi:thiamine biosynthesis lipoprotein